MANKRTAAETLSVLIEELGQETPNDRARIINSLIIWFGVIKTGTLLDSERGGGRDG